MEYIVIVFVGYVLYQILTIREEQKKLFLQLSELQEKIEEISTKIEESRSAIEDQIQSMHDELTPDEVKVKNLVRMGFDPGDAWEYVNNSSLGKNKPKS